MFEQPYRLYPLPHAVNPSDVKTKQDHSGDENNAEPNKTGSLDLQQSSKYFINAVLPAQTHYYALEQFK